MPKKNNERPLIAVCHPERKHLAKGLCKSCYDADYHSRNRERHNEKARQWAKNNPVRRLEIGRKYRYGIEPDVVRARFKAQDGLCKICQTEAASHLDHDHTNSKARGLLCGGCNRALGLFKDDTNLLGRAIRYIELWREVHAIGYSHNPLPALP